MFPVHAICAKYVRQRILSKSKTDVIDNYNAINILIIIGKL